MLRKNEEQMSAVLFDTSLLSDDLDPDPGRAEDEQQRREQRIAGLRESLQTTA